MSSVVVVCTATRSPHALFGSTGLSGRCAPLDTRAVVRDEVDRLLALLGVGEGGHAEVVTSRLDSGDDLVEVGLVEDSFDPEHGGNGIHQVDVETDDLAILVFEFVWGVRNVDADLQLARIRDLGRQKCGDLGHLLDIERRSFGNETLVVGDTSAAQCDDQAHQQDSHHVGAQTPAAARAITHATRPWCPCVFIDHDSALHSSIAALATSIRNSVER